MNRKPSLTNSATHRNRPHRQVLASACALALFAMASAHAQDAQTQTQTPAPAGGSQVDTLDTVRVTGIRAAIATAVETKNESTSIVEAISAEDLGKLPDISIADSISRLPGLAMQRVDGRAQVINIRGMSEQFAGTLLNGREQVSTGDSRGVEFDQYPSELINSVVVYKTPDATLVGQGLSGTVDLQTIRPLSYGERRIVFSGQGEYNSLGDLTAGGKDKGYRIAASYVDQFANDTVGIALGIARMNSPFQEKHYKEWWWADGATLNGWGAPAQPGRPTDAILLQGAEGWVKSRELTRDGVMGVFEFKPNENLHSIVDVYYSKFEQNELMRGLMSNNDPWFTNDDGNPVGYANLGTSNFYGYPVVTTGTLTGVQPIVRNDNNTREDKLTSLGWNTSYKLDPMTFTLDLSYSKADREQSTLETYAGMLDPYDMAFNIPLYNRFGWYSMPDMSNPSTVLLSDPQNYNHDGRMENSWQEDEMKAARFQFSREVESDFLRSYDLGVNVSKRTKEKRADVYFADLFNNRTPVPVGSQFLRNPTSLNFLGMGNVLTYDPRAVLGQYYDVHISEDNNDVLKDYTVDEDVATFYAKANLDIDVSDAIRLRGNVGVQYVRTDQSSTAFNANNGIIAGSQTLGAKYGDILPSMNLALEFPDGWKLRLAAAKTLMRPPINYLSAASSASVAATGPAVWSGSGGNPELEPYRANAVDLSLEKYLGDSSYMALALFYKDLESYVYNQEFPNWDFTGYANNTAREPISQYGSFSTWANGTGGYMRGAELSVSLAGDLLWDPLADFGAQLNASYTESSIDPDGPGGSSTDTIPGLSKLVYNATLYYEGESGFSARVSQRYRDPYRGEYSSLFGQRTYRYTMSERVIDLQLSYDFPSESSLHGLSLLFQVNNVNDEPFRTQVSSSSSAPSTLLFPEEYTEYGRQFLLGFRYEM